MKSRVSDVFIGMAIFIMFMIMPRYLILDTGSAMSMLLIVMPIFIFIVSFIHGYINGFKIYLPVFVCIVFVISMFVYYNSSAGIYAVGYTLISFLGELLGSSLMRIKNSR